MIIEILSAVCLLHGVDSKLVSRGSAGFSQRHAGTAGTVPQCVESVLDAVMMN